MWFFLQTFRSSVRCLFIACPYLIFVIFFTRAKFLENKIYTEKTRKLRQNTQKIAIFLRCYGKIQRKLPIFRVESVKNYTGQKKFTRTCSWGSWQISRMHSFDPSQQLFFYFCMLSTCIFFSNPPQVEAVAWCCNVKYDDTVTVTV